MPTTTGWLPVAEVLVVDASAVVELTVGGPHAARLDRRLRGAVLAAPAHLDAEVLSALGRLQRAGSLTPAETDDALDDVERAPMTRVPITQLLRRAFALRHQLALRHALYAIVAADLDVPLVTVDQRLAAACRSTRVCAIADW